MERNVQKSKHPDDCPVVQELLGRAVETLLETMRTSRDVVEAEQTGELQMADDTTKRGPQDRTRINLSEDHEVRYWSETLGITPERLREVVKEVGNSADKVRQRLGKAA